MYISITKKNDTSITVIYHVTCTFVWLWLYCSNW